jgi:membrane protein DedA with SNARE-associated domain
LIPLTIIGAFLFAGLLKDYVPAFLAFVVGGALGGGIGYFVGEGAVKLIQLVWPTRNDEA